ncbi:MAG: toxin-antitoxin system HicB family antitoxin [Desulfobacteraceae bacterium]|nr:toxin-antitoxin system HicB family antitoxin [Desulfobacteraceae bacterium]
MRAGSELHQALAIRALNQGESLNSYVVKAFKKTVSS